MPQLSKPTKDNRIQIPKRHVPKEILFLNSDWYQKKKLAQISVVVKLKSSVTFWLGQGWKFRSRICPEALIEHKFL